MIVPVTYSSKKKKQKKKRKRILLLGLKKYYVWWLLFRKWFRRLEVKECKDDLIFILFGISDHNLAPRKPKALKPLCLFFLGMKKLFVDARVW